MKILFKIVNMSSVPSGLGSGGCCEARPGIRTVDLSRPRVLEDMIEAIVFKPVRLKAERLFGSYPNLISGDLNKGEWSDAIQGKWKTDATLDAIVF